MESNLGHTIEKRDEGISLYCKGRLLYTIPCEDNFNVHCRFCGLVIETTGTWPKIITASKKKPAPVEAKSNPSNNDSSAESVKAGDKIRSKKSGLLFDVVGVSPFRIFMSPAKGTPNGRMNHKYCRKRQFDMFYEKVDK